MRDTVKQLREGPAFPTRFQPWFRELISDREKTNNILAVGSSYEGNRTVSSHETKLEIQRLQRDNR